MENQDDQKSSPENPLRLYNSLTREVEQFVPRDPARVTMYNCGPTVYSYAHIGNARAAVVADVLFRVLRHIYGEEAVHYARNLTDVDDKIIAAATEQGVPISKITEKFAKIYQDDLAALNCLPPTYEPKATEHIGEMEDIIVELLEKDYAYIAGNQVLFDVSKDEGYGRLVSSKLLEGAHAGVRVAVAGYKRNPGDFLLWKYVAGEDDRFSYDVPKIQAFADGDENWRNYANAPFELSPGRPGWHIECSAMIRDTLGETIDIHCGGIDLKFPHHENEIAQSLCANGKPLAKFWVHNEFLNMGKDKMSKSLGNVTLVHDLLEEWDGEVIRLALLKAHYRSELSWSEDLLRESKAQLDGWYRKFGNISKPAYGDRQRAEGFVRKVLADSLFEDLHKDRILSGIVNNWWEKIALSFFGYADKEQEKRASPNAFVKLLNLLGLLQRDPVDWFSGNASSDDKARFDALAAARQAARAAKDWAEADRIRDEGKAAGIVFEDGKNGTTWRKA